MRGLKAGLFVLLGFILILLFAFGMQALNLEWAKFWNPKIQSVEREVFEETKSYTHGKMEDLAKYYEEYQRAETQEDKKIIQNFVQMRMADLDPEAVNNEQLKEFLEDMMGLN